VTRRARLTSDELDEALRALAHRERRMFLRACLTAPRAAGELAELSQLALATVSEHLKVLRKTELVTLQRDGRFWWYATNRPRLRDVTRSLAALGFGGGDDGT
jgi:DNA-binding transcriptional ArsR family regulator